MKERIFILDNDQMETEPIVDALSIEYEVRYFYNVDDALECLEKDKNYDCFLVDVIMPKDSQRLNVDDDYSTGGEFIKYMRNKLKIKKPIIVLTVVTNEDILGPIRPLVSEIINKPKSPSYIKRKIGGILECEQ